MKTDTNKQKKHEKTKNIIKTTNFTNLFPFFSVKINFCLMWNWVLKFWNKFTAQFLQGIAFVVNFACSKIS